MANVAKGFLNVKDFAARYLMSYEKALRLVNSGEIRALNIAESLSGEPRWLIPWESVEDFERARTNTPPAPKPQRRRRASMEGITRYFS
jgi:hypothetical protein